jgi:hypothetical protein
MSEVKRPLFINAELLDQWEEDGLMGTAQIRLLQAYAVSLESRLSPAWRSMDDAPKDGSEVLISVSFPTRERTASHPEGAKVLEWGGYVRLANSRADGAFTVDTGYYEKAIKGVVGWMPIPMPLPAPPTKEGV